MIGRLGDGSRKLNRLLTVAGQGGADEQGVVQLVIDLLHLPDHPADVGVSGGRQRPLGKAVPDAVKSSYHRRRSQTVRLLHRGVQVRRLLLHPLGIRPQGTQVEILLRLLASIFQQMRRRFRKLVGERRHQHAVIRRRRSNREQLMQRRFQLIHGRCPLANAVAQFRLLPDPMGEGMPQRVEVLKLLLQLFFGPRAAAAVSSSALC